MWNNPAQAKMVPSTDIVYPEGIAVAVDDINGIQNFLLTNVLKLPYRYFICDDSGSMSTADGKRLLVARDGTGKVVKCSRWTEMCESLTFHSNLAYQLNMPSEFRMLNGAAPVMIGGPDAHPEGLAILQGIFSDSPGGNTPLCRQIREVISKITQIEPQLRAAAQRAAVIIVTDGEASDGDLAKAMAPLQGLPVWVVVRLCTDDDSVVQYWNSIDERLELDIDVLDDMIGEAKEVYSANPWLNYCEPLHRLREFGVHMKELDMIDEALLSADQMRAVCSILFDQSLNEMPHPQAEFESFMHCIEMLNRRTDHQFCLYTQRYQPLVDIAKLRRCYGPKSSCSIM